MKKIIPFAIIVFIVVIGVIIFLVLNVTQVQAIKEVQRTKTQEQSIKKEGEAKGE